MLLDDLDDEFDAFLSYCAGSVLEIVDDEFEYLFVDEGGGRVAD